MARNRTSQRSRRAQQPDTGGAGCPQLARAGARRRSGGQHVVDEDHGSRRGGPCPEGPAQGAPAIWDSFSVQALWIAPAAVPQVAHHVESPLPKVVLPAVPVIDIVRLLP